LSFFSPTLPGGGARSLLPTRGLPPPLPAPPVIAPPDFGVPKVLLPVVPDIGVVVFPAVRGFGGI